MATNQTNYHSHCTYCDGRAPLEDFVRAAIRDGFTSYGFSSHAPLPFSTRWTMEQADMDGYLAEAESLKLKYKDAIELYVGLEIDYLNEQSNPAAPYFQDLALDYRIGSVHMLYDAPGELVVIDTKPEHFQERLNHHFGGDLRALITQYYQTLMQMVQAGGFDFVGHFDKVSFNAHSVQPDVLEQAWYKDLVRAYLELVAQKGVMLEVNTKTLHRNGFTYPNRSHFEWIKALKIPVLVNSDAHDPAFINSGRREILLALAAIGLETVRELRAGQWVDVPIG